MSQDELNPQSAAIEAALAALVPTPSDLDRDRLMFLAGRAAALGTRRRRVADWIWPLLTAASVLAALSLTFRSASLSQPAASPGSPSAAGYDMAFVPDRREPKTAATTAGEYLRLRAEVLRSGVIAPGDSGRRGSFPVAPVETPTNRHLLQELLTG